MSEVFSAALVGGLIGTFFGGFTKFLWEKWLPEWLTWRRKQRVERERQLSGIRAPAILAMSDLHARLETIATTQAENYRYVKAQGHGDYYIDSTAYLVAHAFAWQEILRRLFASYDFAELYERLESLTEAFSHGGPGFQVYRLEQTEIGQRLITSRDDDNVVCMSFSNFLDHCEQDDLPRWLRNLRERVTDLLDNPAEELVRVALIDQALIDVLVLLDPEKRWTPRVAAEAMNVAAVTEGWRADPDTDSYAEYDSRPGRARAVVSGSRGVRLPTRRRRPERG